MRHAVRGRTLSRTPSHRRAMFRNMVQSLIEHGEIRTTLPKAREVRPFAEKLVSLAIDGSLAARQRAEAMLNDRSIVPGQNQADYDRLSDAKRAKVLRSRSGRRYRASTTRPGVAFTGESVLHRLFSEVGPRMKRRNEARGCAGGYTRIIKLSERRLGDGGRIAILQWVGENDKPRPRSSDRTDRKRRARAKYDFYSGKARQQRRPARGKGARKAEASTKAGSRPAPTEPQE